ncbi:tyrosine-type recombinase/integrase [Eubacteriales bacterium OttesenSCG-928-K08]|nr:tyrosine-type recombinase/integrase [Eubacteriales bacterium OttesenSCG-928-K08]
MDENYNDKKNKAYTVKQRTLLKELPSCCGTFLRGIESQTSVLTRYGYAVDLKTFFNFLVAEIDDFKGKKIVELTLADMERIKAYDIELFLEHLTYYNKEEREIVNHERAKARKLSTLRSFFKFFFKREMISNNVAALVDAPKLYERSIVRLEANEIAELLDVVEAGAGLSPAQKKYHKATKTRDAAILTLFLGTGIRISELVGIDMSDLDFVNNTFLITRKGGNQDMLVFGAEVRAALLNYLLERETVSPAPGHEKALFLSIQKKRLTVRAIENLVKKYAAIATPLKKISPHKLRSTYGTMLYQETGDIYLVADVLGHKDVNTTRKHYAAISEDRRKIAAQVIKLRDDDNHPPITPNSEKTEGD